jgi:2-methylcitrate dehydratase
MTDVERLAEFVVQASFDDLSTAARSQLKIHVLDALGCAIGAMNGAPVQLVREQIREFDRDGRCSLLGGGRASPDRAAFYNGALVRYLDYNDSYLAKGETCHPSDNLSPVLAAAEYVGGQGADAMVALAVAYQVQCRLSDEAPVRSHGFDHATQGAYAVAAGVSRALGLDATPTANAIAISGTAFNPLRVTRTGALSHWKGLAYANTAAGCVRAAFLARRGITGPLEVFEGNKGFMDAIAGRFEIDWDHEDLERVTRTIIKRHNAEIHAQTAIDAALALKRQFLLTGADVDRIDVDIFDVAYKIIGGGEEGNKSVVATKEQADHSLPYLIAVAILDGEVTPEQFAVDRMQRPDVQQLLRRVSVHSTFAYSQRFPNEMPARVAIRLRDGRTLSLEVTEYPGLNGAPMTWEAALQKFHRLCGDRVRPEERDTIVDLVQDMEHHPVSDLMQLLESIDTTADQRSSGGAHIGEDSSHASHT